MAPVCSSADPLSSGTADAKLASLHQFENPAFPRSILMKITDKNRAIICGYAHVSTNGQDCAQLEAAGCNKIFREKISRAPV